MVTFFDGDDANNPVDPAAAPAGDEPMAAPEAPAMPEAPAAPAAPEGDAPAA